MHSTWTILVEDITSWYDHQTHKIEIGVSLTTLKLSFFLLFFSYSIPWYSLPSQADVFCLCYLFMFWVLPSPCQKAAIFSGHCIPEGSQAFLPLTWVMTVEPTILVLMCFPWSCWLSWLKSLCPQPPLALTNQYVIFETWHPLSEVICHSLSEGERAISHAPVWESRNYFITKHLEKPNPRI